MLEVRKTPDTPDTPDIPLKHRLPIDYTPDGPLTGPLTPLTGPLTPLTGPLTGPLTPLTGPLTVLLVHALYTITIHLCLSSPPKSLQCSSAPPLPLLKAFLCTMQKHQSTVVITTSMYMQAFASSYQQLPVVTSSYQYLPAFAST